MNLTEEQKLIKSLSVIKHVLLVDLGVEDIKSEEEFEDGSKEIFSCIDVIEKHIVDYINSSRPYKFEDLKEDMWVWDDEYKQCIKIKLVFMPCKEYQKGSLKIYHNLNEDNDLDFVEFEENRFFPVNVGCEHD